MVIVSDPVTPSNNALRDPGECNEPVVLTEPIGRKSAGTFPISFHPDDFASDLVHETEGSVVKKVDLSDHPNWCRSLRGWIGVACPHDTRLRVPMRCSEGTCCACFNRWRDKQGNRAAVGLLVGQPVLVLDMAAAPGRDLQTAHAEFVRDIREKLGTDVAFMCIREGGSQQLILRDVPWRSIGWWQRLWRKCGGTYQVKVKSYTGAAARREWAEIIAPLYRLRPDADRKAHSRQVSFSQNWKPSGGEKAGPEKPVLRATGEALWYDKSSSEPLFRGEVVSSGGHSSFLFPPHIAITDRGLLVERWGPGGPCDCAGTVLPDTPILARVAGSSGCFYLLDDRPAGMASGP